MILSWMAPCRNLFRWRWYWHVPMMPAVNATPACTPHTHPPPLGQGGWMAMLWAYAACMEGIFLSCSSQALTQTWRAGPQHGGQLHQEPTAQSLEERCQHCRAPTQAREGSVGPADVPAWTRLDSGRLLSENRGVLLVQPDGQHFDRLTSMKIVAPSAVEVDKVED